MTLKTKIPNTSNITIHSLMLSISNITFLYILDKKTIINIDNIKPNIISAIILQLLFTFPFITEKIILIKAENRPSKYTSPILKISL